MQKAKYILSSIMKRQENNFVWYEHWKMKDEEIIIRFTKNANEETKQSVKVKSDNLYFKGKLNNVYKLNAESLFALYCSIFDSLYQEKKIS